MTTIRIQFAALAVIFLALNTANGFDWSALLPGSERSSRYGVRNFVDSLSNALRGVKEDIEDNGLSREDFIRFGKQLLTGYPLAFVFSVMNRFCASAISSKAIVPKFKPDVTKMKFQLRTICESHNFPLLEAEQLLNSPHFDPKKKVVILASGWATNASDTGMINRIGKAYLCRDDSNFIAVDAAYFVDTLYSWSAFNTEDIGKHIAEGLKKMAEIVPVENIHLIGHSLGAHIVGSAGRHFNFLTGKTIPRITGLDPAMPCFNEGERLTGLSRGDADFIDVIHTNPGILGKRDDVGDVDFYCDGLTPMQPGCFDASCSHARAWEYYAETVYPGQENNFMARRCGSLAGLKDNKCPGKDFPMGYATPYNLKGNYFLEVGSQSPFGKNADKQLAQKYQECGVCKDIQ